MKNRSPALSVGLVVGLLFFAHAMIRNSHAWPMVWPLVAGGAAVLIAARREQLHGFWSGIGVAAKSGLIAGAIFFVSTAAALALLASGSFDGAAAALGAEGPLVVGGAMLSAIALVAAGGVLLAILAGAVTFPFVRKAR